MVHSCMSTSNFTFPICLHNAILLSYRLYLSVLYFCFLLFSFLFFHFCVWCFLDGFTHHIFLEKLKKKYKICFLEPMRTRQLHSDQITTTFPETANRHDLPVDLEIFSWRGFLLHATFFVSFFGFYLLLLSLARYVV